MSEKRRFSLADAQAPTKAAVKAQADLEASSKGDKYAKVTLTEGENMIRVYPAHPGTSEGNIYTQPVCEAWIKFIAKDGKDSGKEVNRTVKNARIHGGLKKDIVEEYIKGVVAYIIGERKFDTRTKGTLLDAIQGSKEKGKEKEAGIAYKTKYALLAKKDDGGKITRGVLTISAGTKKKMDFIDTTGMQTNPDKPAPIADPKNGSYLVITYDSKADGNNMYKAALDRDIAPLDAEDEDWWADQTPLSEQLNGIYNKNEFNKALLGLEFFDSKNKIGYYKSDDFQDLIAELLATVPDAPERDNADSDAAADEDEVKLEEMDRQELKQFIIDNDLADAIPVTRKMTEDDILDAIEKELGFLPEYPSDLKKKAEKKPAAKAPEPEEPFEADEEEDEPEVKPARRAAKAAPEPAVEPEEEEEEDDKPAPRASRSERRSRR